jgi:hypothetical protein
MYKKPKKEEEKIWIQKEGNNKLENSVLINDNVGENCRPISQ